MKEKQGNIANMWDAALIMSQKKKCSTECLS